MKEAYVSYEVAKLLKEKGFTEFCLYYYQGGNPIRTCSQDRSCYEWNNNHIGEEWYSCPTQQMACRWLREEHDIMIIPNRDKIVDVASEPFYDYYCIIRHNGNEYWVSSLDLPEGQHYTEYEDAVEAALQYCLTNLI